MQNYQKIVLPNNLRVILIPMKETEAITAYFLFKVGSRYEEKEQNGISHFLEHLFFKGTKKRPSGFELFETLDSIGAHYNAFTSDEVTGFYIQAGRFQFGLIIDVLFDILQNSLFAPREIERERGVILQEINMRQDVPMSYVHDLYKQLLFGDTPLGRLVIGTSPVIKALKLKNFVDYKNKLYSASSAVLALSGRLTASDIQIAKKYARRLNKGEKNSFESYLDKQNQPKLHLHFRKTDQAHLVLGFKSIPARHPLKYAQEILSIILGTSASSRLFTELREKRGLCYYVHSETWYFSDAGSLLAGAGVPIEKVEKSVRAILNEFKKVRDKGVTAGELKKAKEYYKGKIALEMESSYQRASFYADQELLLDKIETPQEKIKKMEKVTAGDVKKVAREVIKEEGLNLALIGPFEEKEKFKKLLDV